jgi:secreted trypsin-like serine protease
LPRIVLPAQAVAVPARLTFDGGPWRLLVTAFLVVGCGEPAASDIRAGSFAVVGGAAVDAAEYPATGALIEWLATGAPLLLCTATLVAPQVVLTAGHCLVGRAAHLPDFTTLPDIASARRESIRHGSRAHVYPAFDSTATGSVHDLALMELDAPMEDVAPERFIAPVDANEVIAVGDNVELVGYGSTATDDTPGHERNAGDAPVSAVATDEFTVGGRGEVQDCFGDSGGPSFTIGSGGTRRLVGVTSRSANDATGCIDGSIHTRVAAYASWMTTTLRAIPDVAPAQSASCSMASAATNGGHFANGWLLLVAGLGTAARRRLPHRSRR